MGKSTDKGETWQTKDLYASHMYFYKVIFDEENPAILYASGLNRGYENDSIWVFHSTDMGDSWRLAYKENLNMDCGGVLDMVMYENKLIFYTFRGLFELDLSTTPLLIHTIDSKPDISIYPNPVRNTLYFDTKTNIKRIEIIDCTGRVIQKNLLNRNERQINVSRLDSGVYFVVFSGEQQVVAKKMVISK